MSDTVFTAIFIASGRKTSGALLSVTLRAGSRCDALYKAERKLTDYGYYNIEYISIHVAGGETSLGIDIIDDS